MCTITEKNKKQFEDFLWQQIVAPKIVGNTFTTLVDRSLVAMPSPSGGKRLESRELLPTEKEIIKRLHKELRKRRVASTPVGEMAFLAFVAEECQLNAFLAGLATNPAKGVELLHTFLGAKAPAKQTQAPIASVAGLHTGENHA